MYSSDKSLRRAVAAFGASYDEMLVQAGAELGSAPFIEHGRIANIHQPILHTHDRYGHRVDRVEYHPSYHTLLHKGLTNGTAAFGWNRPDDPGAHVARAALMYMHNAVDPGSCCPQVMTFAAIPAMLPQPEMSDWVTKLCAQAYDPRDVPISEKQGVTMGMSMTEKQGGSDVRANTTVARPIDPAKIGSGKPYHLRGHKWFTSAPMSDGFLALAQTDSGLSCFLVPRWLPDGSRNTGFRIMRLKNKVGDKSNASSEVEYDDAWGMMVGQEGKGVQTIIQMVQCTRLDCTLGSAAVMKHSLLQVLNHVVTRKTFGKELVYHPLMQNVLIDLLVESEASTITALRLAKALELSNTNEHEKALFRIGTAVSKYFVTKRQPQFVYECMECFGGNGYTEDFPLARYFRQSPLNSIWEGSGNVMCLDILRAAPLIPSLLAECKTACGDLVFNEYLAKTENLTHTPTQLKPSDTQAQVVGRVLGDRLATALQGSLMIRYGDMRLAQAFIASRMSSSHVGGVNYGTLPVSVCDPQVIFDNIPQP